MAASAPISTISTSLPSVGRPQASTQPSRPKKPMMIAAPSTDGVQSPVRTWRSRALARSAASIRAMSTPASSIRAANSRSSCFSLTRSAGLAALTAAITSASATAPSPSRTRPISRVAMPASGPPSAAASVGATVPTMRLMSSSFTALPRR
jgi:hypothetical protein